MIRRCYSEVANYLLTKIQVFYDSRHEEAVAVLLQTDSTSNYRKRRRTLSDDSALQFKKYTTFLLARTQVFSLYLCSFRF